MKKFTSLFLVIVLSALFVPYAAFADTQFSDLSSNHWAYANVQTLVAEGTISGFEDGSFRPNDTVTRAQFVKMIGKGTTRYAADFADVAPNHWAYEYVMYSGLVANGTASFLPDQAIKRIEVVELLWKRAGAKAGFSAPGIITNQAKNKDAVAWAYSCGIINGDDGIHLRLDDTMSRAEGAALIIRSREKSAQGATASFVNTVKEDILKQAYTSLDLFNESTYNAAKKITFGELARATVRIAGSEYDPSYYTLTSTVPFEHEYARDLDVLGRNVIGEDKVTKEIIDKNVTVGDVIAAFSFGALYRSAEPFAVNETSEKFAAMANAKNRLLTFASKHGVQVDTDASLTALGREATIKDAMAIAIQIDSFIGMQTDYSTDTNIIGNVKYNHSLDLTGRKYDGFKLVLKDMPSAVYTTEFTKYADNGNVPADAYRFAQAYTSVFTTSLTLYKSKLAEKGLDCSIVYYPSLVVDNGNGYTMRVKVTVKKLGSATDLASYANCNDKSYQLEAGKSFYADIASGETLSSITMNADKMFIDKVIY